MLRWCTLHPIFGPDLTATSESPAAITLWARRISTVGGSFRYPQLLAGHSALTNTQRYIDGAEEASRRVGGLVRYKVMIMIFNVPRIFRQLSKKTIGGLILFIVCLGLPISTMSVAMEIKTNGNQAIMSGPVVGSDCDELRTILRKQSIKQVIFRNSGGGNANAGYCVGSLIRQNSLSTIIQGRCASSCSRMWLGGVTRELDGADSRVGLHGNYDRTGSLLVGAPDRLRTWITAHAPSVDRKLLEQWMHLPINQQMMYFYNSKAELCERKSCSEIRGRNARNVGLSTK